MKRPGFLIIGAMKAGTTSLYRDLLTNPAVFMPIDKEPECLCHDGVLTDAGLADYLRPFEKARPEQLCGEASTAYTKLPDFPGVPRRARKVLGPDLKIIYLVREPVARTISHHHHDFTYGLVHGDIDRAVREEPRFIAYSRYAMQVEPWIGAYGPERVRIVRFEDYIRARSQTVAELSRFLGITPRPDLVDESRVFNRSQERVVVGGPFGLVQRSPLYRRLIRPMLPHDVKDRLRSALLPVGPGRPVAPNEATIGFIREQLADDTARLNTLLGSPGPVWGDQGSLTKAAG